MFGYADRVNIIKRLFVPLLLSGLLPSLYFLPALIGKNNISKVARAVKLGGLHDGIGDVAHEVA